MCEFRRSLGNEPTVSQDEWGAETLLRQCASKVSLTTYVAGDPLMKKLAGIIAFLAPLVLWTDIAGAVTFMG